MENGEDTINQLSQVILILGVFIVLFAIFGCVGSFLNQKSFGKCLLCFYNIIALVLGLLTLGLGVGIMVFSANIKDEVSTDSVCSESGSGFSEADITFIAAADMLCRDICPCKLTNDIVDSSNWNSTEQAAIKDLLIDESHNAINLFTCDPQTDSPIC